VLLLLPFPTLLTTTCAHARTRTAGLTCSPAACCTANECAPGDTWHTLMLTTERSTARFAHEEGGGRKETGRSPRLLRAQRECRHLCAGWLEVKLILVHTQTRSSQTTAETRDIFREGENSDVKAYAVVYAVVCVEETSVLFGLTAGLTVCDVDMQKEQELQRRKQQYLATVQQHSLASRTEKIAKLTSGHRGTRRGGSGGGGEGQVIPAKVWDVSLKAQQVYVCVGVYMHVGGCKQQELHLCSLSAYRSVCL